jgi:hypothetical protein
MIEKSLSRIPGRIDIPVHWNAVFSNLRVSASPSSATSRGGRFHCAGFGAS